MKEHPKFHLITAGFISIALSSAFVIVCKIASSLHPKSEAEEEGPCVTTIDSRDCGTQTLRVVDFDKGRTHCADTPDGPFKLLSTYAEFYPEVVEEARKRLPPRCAVNPTYKGSPKP